MLATLRGMRDALASDAREERRGMELFGSVGLFADGSIENSGYDLMYDIEQINKIIFKQAPTYSGLRNDNGRGINNVLAGNFGDGTDTEASDEEESETATGSVL